jgi:hypothetical protein
VTDLADLAGLAGGVAVAALAGACVGPGLIDGDAATAELVGEGVAESIAVGVDMSA